MAVRGELDVKKRIRNDGCKSICIAVIYAQLMVSYYRTVVETSWMVITTSLTSSINSRLLHRESLVV